MKRKVLVLIMASLMVMAGCADLGYVEKNKFDELQKKLEESEKKLEESEKQNAEFEAHRYSIYRESWRTWRMDAVSGKTCILLTSQADWKK
jgi:hypothetical protein